MIRITPFTILSIAASLVIIAGFFLPWIHVRLLGLVKITESTGFELPVLVADLFEDVPPWLPRTVYLIPLAALLTLVAELRSNRWLSLAARLAAVLLTGYWTYLILQMAARAERRLAIVEVDPADILQSGFYLTVAGAGVYVITLLSRRGR